MTKTSEKQPLNSMLGERYRVVSVISEKDSGSIYAADDLESGKRIAVKIQNVHFAATREVVVRVGDHEESKKSDRPQRMVCARAGLDHFFVAVALRGLGRFAALADSRSL